MSSPTKKNELYIYGGAFGLPTINPSCLAVISYLNAIAYEDYTLIECNDPGMSPTGELPMLHDGKIWVSGANRIIAYLAKTGRNADQDLTGQEKAKSTAYQALVDETLADAILFSWFADADNFLGATRKAYSKLLSFPGRYYQPIQMRKAAVQRVQKYGGVVAESGAALIKADNTKIYDAARECYRVLNRCLGEKEFFFGSSPSTLDAKVFGYLALQFYPELPSPRFQAILQSQFPRLVTFCDRCRDRFLTNLPAVTTETSLSSWSSLFASSGSTPYSSAQEWFTQTFLTPASEKKMKENDEEGTKPKKSEEERDFDLKRVYAIAFGVVAMVTYVIVNGIVVIGDDEEEMDEESYYRAQVAGVLDEIHVPLEEHEDDE